MIIVPDLKILVPDPSPRSELDVFVSMDSYRRRISQWLGYFRDPPEEFAKFLNLIFGSDEELIERRCALYIRVLNLAAERLGPGMPVWLVGCPSRINWEGHHVDHQGGWYNATTDEHELVAAVARRDDPTVRVMNIDPRFPDGEFSLADQEPACGVWAAYVKGSFLAVLKRCLGRSSSWPTSPAEFDLHGADLVVGGDIPVGGGRSSSHALCVVAVLAAVAVNGLRLDKRAAVACAQEAEWYAGSRTGLGDQAAMIFGRRGMLFSSPVVEERGIEPNYTEFPDGIARVIVDSFIRHQLQGVQRIEYSGRVCAYRIAFPLLLDALLKVGADEGVVAATRRLSDINPDRFPLALIYRALLHIPCEVSLDKVREEMSLVVRRLNRIGVPLELHLDDLLGTYFGEGPFPATLKIRGVALYGLSECRRSVVFSELVEAGRLTEAARLVSRGHDGDRVSRRAAGGEYASWQQDVSDEYLLRLIKDLESGKEEAVTAAQLEYQTGSYGASHPFLDRIVDACLEAGALCASLTGGGLGGVVTALVEESRLELLKNRIMRLYRDEQDRIIAWLDIDSFAAIAGSREAADELLASLRALWTRKQRALEQGQRWQPTHEDRSLIDRLAGLVSRTETGGHLPPNFQLFLADETRDGIKLNRSIDAAGFIHPPPHPPDYRELWEERTTAALRSQEKAALRSSDWVALERIALQQHNLAYRRLRLRRKKGGCGSHGDTFLVTGAAGFIGSHLCRRLLSLGHHVIALDDFNDYYDPFLKFENIRDLLDYDSFDLYEGDFRDVDLLERIFRRHQIDQIVHLGARAGVRPSIQDPQLYVTANVLGTQNLLDMARRYRVTNFVYASSSSVYGGSKQFPFSESQPVDHPISPYAATKKANEVQASCYHRLYGFPVTGLRFFTVYGPGGRPDMAIRKFIELLARGKPVPVYGDGSFERDYTYIDDIVDGIIGAIRASKGRRDWDEVINLGESDTTSVREIILLIADRMGVIQLDRDPKELDPEQAEDILSQLQAQGLIEILPEQLGDVPKTYADISKAKQLIGYKPQTKIQDGIERTVRRHTGQKRPGFPDELWRQAVGMYVELAQRAALDSFGRPRDPLYTRQDLLKAIETCDLVESLRLIDKSRINLGYRLLASIHRLVGEIAAYLRSPGDRPWGMTGLLVHRRRLAILDEIYTAADRPLKSDEQDWILQWSREVIQLCGAREVVLAVAAAGLGTRIAGEVGGYERKHRLFLGDEMLLLSLRNTLPFARRIVVVASETNRRDIAQLLERSEINEECGFCIEYVIQRERLGDGDAHLTAAELLEGFDGIIVFLFADAPTKRPETVAKMVTLKQALGPLVPLVVPCYVQDRPYAPVVTAPDGPDRGAVLWNWQKADEEDFDEARVARAGRAPRNVGLFAAESSIFAPLREYKLRCFFQTQRYQGWREKLVCWDREGAEPSKRPKPAEFGFADVMKVLSSRGTPIAAPTFATEEDRLNVNDPLDADAVRAVYRRTCPQVRVEVEKREAKGEVIVKFVDLDAKGEPIRTSGRESYRNYTRLRFGPGTDFSSPEVERAVAEHIRTITQRIESEIGLRVVHE